MLTLNDIKKDYVTGDETVHALRGVSMHFRPHEFVAILGPSGCGKTTLLNIIGGLDHYTEGDLVIGGVSTKEYKDKDWDSYRNHRVGFVFQSYNLIPHQTVLSNVELALTLSGVSPHERRARATAALESVGLAGQIKKKPNQMSGGQMQRVAIARALVNDPDIILADEPTGALDTTTSTQIMDILRSISDKKLIVMVTHNPEIAEEYATRIIRVKDGLVIEDSNPYDGVSEEATEAASSPVDATEAIASESNEDSVTIIADGAVTTEEGDCAPAFEVELVDKTSSGGKKKAKKEKTSMSLLTAFSLSLNNLMTKKARTFLTSFAGSIGIIGIALILALSNGIQVFIDQVQEDTLSTYPLSIMEQSQDLSAMLGAMTEVGKVEDHSDSNMIYVDDSMGTMMSAMSKVQKNNLEKFKAYIDDHYDELEPYISAIQYTYQFDLQVFSGDGKTQINPTTIFESMGDSFAGISDLMGSSGMTISAMSEMIDNQELLNQQYDVVAGNWPTNANEIVLVITKNNQISKLSLYMLGMLDQSEIEQVMKDLMAGKDNYDTTPMDPYSYDDFLGKTFRLMNTSDFFRKTNRKYTVDGVEYPIWEDIREADLNYDQASYVTNPANGGVDLKIAGIIRPRKDVAATSISTNLAYTKELTDLVLDMNTKSEVIAQQKSHPEHNVLTGVKFERTYYTPETIHELISKVDDATMEMFYASMRERILENPDYSDMLNIKDKDSFLGFYMLMPLEKQSSNMGKILDAVAANEADTTMLFTLINQMNASALPGVTISAQNFRQLLPVLSTQTQALALSGLTAEQASAFGIPAPVAGLIELAGEPAMTTIYAEATEDVKTMEINEEVFLRILGTMDAEDTSFKELEEMLYKMATDVDATLESTLELLGDSVAAKPASINFYAIDFESKDKIVEFIAGYNDSVDEADKMKYTDVVGMLMSSITTILNVITYVLVAFVAISLIVSSIMIGIITYISVLERIKEIGILRAIGASKGNVAQVFLAETAIVGFFAGVIGIVATVVLCIPTNLIIRAASGFNNISAQLPIVGALVLIAISMLLTLVAGLLPAMIAAKKEPVEALRSE